MLLPIDGTLTIYDGGSWNGTASPSFSSSSPGLGVTLTYKSLKINADVDLVSTKGAGDVQQFLRPNFGKQTVTIEAMIAQTGIIPITLGGYGKVTFLPVSGGSLQVYLGLWKSQDVDISADTPQMQTLVLECTYDTV